MSSEPTSATKTPDVSIVVAVREGEDGPEFFMVRHPSRGWELPGGKLEGKEGPVHCALREFREETGHLLSNPHFVLKVPRDDYTVYVFTGGLGELVGAPEDDAVEDMQWFRRLPTEDLAFPDDPYDEIGEALAVNLRTG